MNNIIKVPWVSHRVTRRLEDNKLLFIVQKQDERGWYDIAECVSLEVAIIYRQQLDKQRP